MGREKRQCFSIELKTRNCHAQVSFSEVLVGMEGLACHAKGTFFRFARMSTAATSRDLLPGPVNVLMRKFRRLTRDAPTPTTRAAVNATMGIDFRGRRRVAEAMAVLRRD